MPLTETPATIDGSVVAGHKNTWRQRFAHELRRFLSMFIYLWAVLGLMMVHESVVLARYDLPFTRWGFALVTALVTAKVMLVMEDLNVVRGFAGKPLIYPILCKSVVYAIVFIAFYIAEEVVGGLVRGESLRASIPNIGGGTPQGVLLIGLITTVALIPYFAFKELGHAIGEKELHAHLFRRGRGQPARGPTAPS
jgi:hypothetical protein